jgi:hypothetical protein
MSRTAHIFSYGFISRQGIRPRMHDTGEKYRKALLIAKLYVGDELSMIIDPD